MKKASIALLPALATLAFAGPAHASLSATTGAAAAVTDTTAVLNGGVDSSGSPTYYFEYGPTAAYGSKTAPVPFDQRMSVQTLVAGLTPATVYHFRLVAARPDRAARGADATFVTASSPIDPVLSGPLVGGLPTSSGGGSDDPTPADGAGGGDQGAAVDGGNAGGGGDTGDGAGDAGGGDQPTSAGGVSGSAVQPVIGETIGAAPVTGTVSVQPPGGGGFVPLADGAPIQDGSAVDARHGSVTIVTAVGDGGDTQTATFHGSVFQVRQNKAAGGLTDIYLRGGNFATACRPAARSKVPAVTAARSRKRPVRRLWGHDHGGSFRTHGRGAIATVRGTTWIVADHCNGTRTSVLSGAVSVWDKRLRRSVLVHAEHSYFARTG
jgi:hypothetical protein